MPKTQSKLILLEEEGLESNENYKSYLIQKEEIKSKYPSSVWKYPPSGRPKANELKNYIENEHIFYKQYINELLDLMLQPNAHFQKFLWDIIPETTLEVMERRAKGKRKKYDLE